MSEKYSFSFNQVKGIDEILKFRDCSKTQGMNYSGNFYSCNLAEETPFHLCEYCQKNCHKGHGHKLISKGNYECSCAKHKHLFKKVKKKEAKCFYLELFKISPGDPIYLIDDGSVLKKEYCSVCTSICLNKKCTKNEESKKKIKYAQCNCKRHDVSSAVLLLDELYSNSNFFEKFRNFDFNLFYKVGELRRITFDELLAGLKKIALNQETINLITEASFVAILNLFYLGTMKWKNKYFYLRIHDEYLTDVKGSDQDEKLQNLYNPLIELLQYKNPKSDKEKDTDKYDIFRAKMLLSNVAFSSLIRREQIKKKGLYGIHTIINMNIKQRRKYIINSDNKKIPSFQKKLIKGILDLYGDFLIKFCGKPFFAERAKNEIFPLFNKMMKFVIKYDIIDSKGEFYKKYFECVRDTIKISGDSTKEDNNQKKKYEDENGEKEIDLEENKEKDHIYHLEILQDEVNKKVDDNHQGKKEEIQEQDAYNFSLDSNLFIMRSIFYYLLYTNDKMCYKYINNVKTETEYSFIINTSSPVMEDIKAIFFTLLKNGIPNLKDREKKMFSDTVSYIFRLMCQKNENFYSLNFNNLKYLPPEENYKNKNIEDCINNFTVKITKESRKFILHETEIKEYDKEVNQLIKEFIQELGIQNIDLSKKYLTFIKNGEINKEEYEKRIKEIKNPEEREKAEKNFGINSEIQKNLHKIAKNTRLLPCLAQCIYLIEINSKNSLFDQNTKEQLINLFYLLILNDRENLCLVMDNFPETFFNFFGSPVYKFIGCISETILSSNYQFDNYYFITEIILKIKEGLQRLYKTGIGEERLKIENSGILLNIITQFIMKNKVFYGIEFLNLNKEILEFLLPKGDKNHTNTSFSSRLLPFQIVLEFFFSGYIVKEKVKQIFLKNYFDFMSSSYLNESGKYAFDVEKYDITLPRIIMEDIFNPTSKYSINKLDNSCLLSYIRYIIIRTMPFQSSITKVRKLFSNILLKKSDNLEKKYDPILLDLLILNNTTSNNNNTSQEKESNNNAPQKPNNSTENNNIEQLNKDLEIREFNFIAVQIIGPVFGKLMEINLVMKKFEEIYEKISKNKDIDLIIELMRFYETAILKPSYFLIKIIENFSPLLQGRVFHLLLEFVKNFASFTAFFYEKLKEISNQIRKTEYGPSLRQILDYEQINIRTTLSQTSRTGEFLSSFENAIQIPLQKIHFFEVPRMIEIYQDIVERVFLFNKDSNAKRNSTAFTKEVNLESIETFLKEYDTALKNGSELIKFKYSYFDSEMIKAPFFSLIQNKDIFNLELKNLPNIGYFISLMECISDIDFCKNPEEKKVLINALKAVANKDTTKNYLLLITYSNLSEIMNLFQLKTIDEFESKTVHCYLNTSLTKFFQILCEGNQIKMKKALFNMNFKVTDFLEESINKDNDQGNDKDLKKERGKKNSLSQKNSTQASRKVSNLNPAEDTNNNDKDKNMVDFFSLICLNFKNLITFVNWKKKKTLTKSIFKRYKGVLYTNITKMVDFYTNLLIEMIQGFQFIDDSIFLENKSQTIQSGFYELCKAYKKMQEELKYKIDEEVTSKLLVNFFFILENILKQDFVDKNNCTWGFIRESLYFIDSKCLLGFYICKLYKEFQIEEEKKEKPKKELKEKKKESKIFECTEKKLKDLLSEYKINKKMHECNLIKIGVSLHFILKKAAELLGLPSAIEYNQAEEMNFKEVKEKHEEEISKSRKETMSENNISRSNTEKESRSDKKKSDWSMSRNDSIYQSRGKNTSLRENSNSQIESYYEKDEKIKSFKYVMLTSVMMASKFFGKILKSVEIKQIKQISVEEEPKDTEANQEDTQAHIEKQRKKISRIQEVKTVYFQLTPELYLIKNRDMENLLKNANRESRTTKLKTILDQLEDFCEEIEYKSEIGENDQDLYNIDYLEVDKFNCWYCYCLYLLIGIGLSLNEGTIYRTLLTKIPNYMEFFLILFNFKKLGTFWSTKYKLNISLLTKKNKSDLETTNPLQKLFLYFKIYAIDANEEVALMLYITFIGIIGSIFPYDIIIYSFQLVIISKFIPTIQDILEAFKRQFAQLFSMIGFLAILMFVFANVDYYFLRAEYLIEQDDGTNVDYCSNLVECFMTLFNHGARSGGGIGDILPERVYPTLIYFVRWMHDMFFFICVTLLLLNMINGVIVTAFSQIREDGDEEREDKENKCYICSVQRFELEKENISFKEHCRKTHSVKNYVRYLLYLKMKDKTEMDQNEYYVYGCIDKNGIEFFPGEEKED